MSQASQVPVGTKAGEYEIVGLLGKGGMGTVYAGVHPIIGKAVAIKVLAPELAVSESIVARFVREARAVNQIRHRNIVDVFAFGQTPELGHYFVMPRLEGENLEQRIKRTGPLSPRDLVPLLDQTASALDAAHAAGIYHRDLKPENVFLVREHDGSDAVQVLDFGIAKLTSDDAVSTTRTGAQMGTPLYMSPEQWDAGEVDQRTDVYALGVLIHHAITGRYPFEARTPLALMNQHGSQPPTLPSAFGGPPWLDPIIARALAKSKSGRFDSAGELARAFADGAGASSGAAAVAAAPSSIGYEATLHGSDVAAVDDIGDRPATRKPWGVVAVVLGLFAAGGVVIALSAGGGSSDGQADAAPVELSPAPAAPALSPMDAAAAPAAEPEPADASEPKPRSEPRKPEPRKLEPKKPPPEKPEPKKPPPEKPEPKKPPPDKPGWGETVDPFGDN